MDTSRINNTWPVAKEGIPFIVVSSGFAILFACLGFACVAIPLGVIALFIIFFFRDPDRRYETDEEGVVLTPADGTVLEVRRLDGDDNPIGKSAVKVSIFMSIFNVHVNRVPIGGMIERIAYHPGKFFSANLDKASTENENNVITLTAKGGERIAFVQIAGFIARRIACWIQKGDVVVRGQRFGLIRFGSRLEVYLPSESRIAVRVRQKVKAGVTAIGRLPSGTGEEGDSIKAA
ncbi:MAG: phosphatidylserine decarboxylase family protein [Deltaproteobacteria bacterium]|nr:phosphatidylserine decarboxylase family protein [Deltaproteobacteria bacterium]